MADPQKFTPGYSYTGWQTSNPTKPLPASRVDQDMAGIATSTDSLVNAVKDVRRSDGALKNGIVTVDSLSPAVKAILGSSTYLSTVATNIDDIITAADNIASVNSVAAIDDDVSTVAGVAANVTTVAGISAAVSDVAAVDTAVSAVAAIDDAVSAVAAVAANVTTVAGISADVSTVAALSDDIPPLATRVLPTGGIAGQIPVKQSSAEGDCVWANPPGGGDMLSSIYDPNDVEADAFDSANHAYDNATSGLAATTTQTAVDELAAGKLDKTGGNIGDAVAQAAFRAAIGIDPWEMQPIGVPVALEDHIAGVLAPPTDREYRYIKLTAGLTGSGGYNAGALTSESVTGSAPLVQATAVISLDGSPIDGQTVRLLNTEGRFLRASTTPGAAQADAMQGHRHNRLSGNGYAMAADGGGAGFSGAGTVTQVETTGDPVEDASNGTVRVANETRTKNIGVAYYLRIK